MGEANMTVIRHATRIALAGVLVTGILLAGCATDDGTPADNMTDDTKTEQTEPASGGSNDTSEEPIAGMVNPWSETETAEEAGEGAGIGTFSVPDEVKCGKQMFDKPTFTYMTGIAQATYERPDAEITVRKGTKSGIELTGDWTEYEKSWDIMTGDIIIKCHGHKDGDIILAEWGDGTPDNVHFCILTQGFGDEDIHLTTDELTALVTTGIK